MLARQVASEMAEIYSVSIEALAMAGIELNVLAIYRLI